MAKCINDLIQASKGTISRKEAESIIKEIEQKFQRPMPKTTPKDMGALPAEARSPEARMYEAAQEAFAEKVQEKETAVRRRELQVEAASRLQFQIARTATEGQYNKALRNIINQQVAGRIKAITDDFMTELYRGLEPFLSKIGFRKLTREEAAELVTVMMDEEQMKGLTYKKPEDLTETEYLARQYRLASDRAYHRANEAGADIGYLSGRIPQTWDSRGVRYFGLSAKEQAQMALPGTSKPQRARLASRARERWIDFVMPKLDAARYVDPETGAQLDDAQMREMLASVWQTLATHGLSKGPDGLVEGSGPSLAEKLGAHRELHFKDAESFLDANDAFGQGDLYTAIVGDLQRKAQAIGLMEVFGPNPETGFRTANAYAKSQQAHALTDGRHGSTINELMFEELMGKTRGAQEDRFDLANRFMQGLRNYITASKMGMLLLSQVNDIATFRAIAQTDGLDTGRAFKVALEFLNPMNAADREIARKQGILTQSVINDVAMRYGAEQTNGMSRKLANWTVTLTGAEHWTNAMKMAFQSLVGSHVADYRGKVYGDLDPAFRRMLERYDIREEDWNIIRESESVSMGGVEVVTPYLVKKVITRDMSMESGRAAVDQHKAGKKAVQEAATKFGAMLAEEADTGMLTPDTRTQAIIHQSTRPGTLWGEFARSMMLFKTFSIAMLTRALPRIFAEGVGYSRASTAAQWALGMIVGGALSMQLKDLAKGRNPRDMADPHFWAAAALQSGGMGIFGDFVFNDVNRFGGSLAGSIGGPVVGFAEDLRKLTVGNMAQAAEGEDTHFTAESIQFAKNYAPLMNLWYTRLALDHLLFYHVQEAANPGYLRRMKGRVERENGQTFWWSPDENTPEMPNLMKAFGGE